MAFQWLVDWLTGQMVLVDVPAISSGPPPTGGTALYADASNIGFIDGTDMDWIT
jgi:hypothetical protein